MADARQVAADVVAAFNAHDEERIRESYTEDAIYEAPGELHVEGREAIHQYTMAWLNAFPDANVTIHDELVDGDWVANRFTFSGTQTGTLVGPAGEIPATGRRVDGRGVQILRAQNGKVAEFHLYFDQVQLLTQLGLMPEPAAASA